MLVEFLEGPARDVELRINEDNPDPSRAINSFLRAYDLDRGIVIWWVPPEDWKTRSSRERQTIERKVGPMSKGLDGRSRDEDGQIRAKRSDTKVSTLAETYPEFEGLPPNETLGELKQQLGTESLDQTRRALRDKSK
jgi:hypothetical protein